ncbi:MAG: hypothetical protein Q7T54_05330 [Candidatus Levybacteria bacterium]|nr:hypothetical protein [Candidatus Levybacteria bacterium]
MSEFDDSTETEETRTVYDVTPISPTAAIGLEDFLPQLFQSGASEFHRQYISDLGGDDTYEAERSTLIDHLQSAVEKIPVEDAIASRRVDKQIPLLRFLQDNKNRIRRADPENSSAAFLYETGFIAMFEALKRSAREKGGALPIVTNAAIDKAKDMDLTEYPDLLAQIDQWRTLFKENPKEFATQTIEKGAVSDSKTNISALKRIVDKEMIKQFPKVEPNFYKVAGSAGLWKLPRKYSANQTPYKEALFGGIIDTRNAFLAEAELHKSSQ